MKVFCLFIFFISISWSILSQESEDTTRQVYYIVDEMPIFDDSTYTDLPEFFIRNFTGIDSLDCRVSYILIEFIIESDGSISSKKVTIPDNRIHCENEKHSSTIKELYVSHCKELINKLPQFIPGKLNGKNVPVKMEIPMHIHMQ